MISDEEKQAWTMPEESTEGECICSGGRVVTIPTKGGPKPAFVLDLVIEETGRILIKFYNNVTKTKKGNYTVKHDSDFARICRLTLGAIKKGRYSRADQLLRNFRGYKFIAKYESARSSFDLPYFKATKVRPIEQIISDEWLTTGKVKPKKKNRKQKLQVNDSLESNTQQSSNELTKDKQKLSNGLTMGKAENPHSNLVSTTISSPLKDLTSNIKPLPHITTPISRYTYERVEVKGKCRSFYYQQCHGETEDAYNDRVLEESLNIS